MSEDLGKTTPHQIPPESHDDDNNHEGFPPRPTSTPESQYEPYSEYPPKLNTGSGHDDRTLRAQVGGAYERRDQTLPAGMPAVPPPPQQGDVERARLAKTRMKARRKQRGCGWLLSPGCLLGCMGVIGAFAVLFLIIAFVVYYQVSQRLEDRIDELEVNLNTIGDPNVTSGFETTFIYDREGEKLYEVFGQGRRKRIPLDEMPEELLWATISVEDDDFYSNPGFDPKSNLRAVSQYVRTGTVVSGASTITQQLVRNVFFPPEYRREQSVQRKIEEILLSAVLTQRYDKDTILELYLNEIYYGNLAYGIEAASQTYFGKSAAELELHEAALLAGLPQSPSQLDPFNPDPAVQRSVYRRQWAVLDFMVKEEYISEEEAESAKGASLYYVSPEVPLEAPHFTLYAKDELESKLLALGYPPEFINEGGLQVYTTINLQFQDIAQSAAENSVRQLRERHNMTNASVVVIHPPSGQIMAMVGSVDYNDESIDGQVNVSVAQRQPGSTMKPFTYAAAFEQGWTPATIIWDTETSFGIAGQAPYIPKNYDGRFHGPVRARDALANSYNIPAVKTLRYIGVDYLLNMALRVGIQSLGTDASQFGLALTLGGGEVTLLEMTNGYATFARYGNYVAPTSILCIIDKNDNIIYEYELGCPEGKGIRNNGTHSVNVTPVPVMDPRIAFMISDILADNAARTPAMGSNSSLNTGALHTSVKTGTTNDYKDNWTIGYTHDIAVGVWTGNSNGEPMVNSSGLTGAAPIWNETMLSIYRNYPMPESSLPQPQGVSLRRICNIRGMRDPVTDCSQINEWFLDGQAVVPDGRGSLIPVNLPQPTPPPAPSDYGPRLQEIEPGIWRTVVRPLDDAQAAVLMSQSALIQVKPKYCLVPIEVVDAILDEQIQVFIAPPERQEEHRNAYQYAINANVPILPQAPCTPETLGPAQGPPPEGVTVQIISPANGETVSGNVPIYGIVHMPPPHQFFWYIIEVKGGQWADWTTLGQQHFDQVPQAAQLETFLAEAVPPGQYQLRIKVDGSIWVEPIPVTINLVSP